MNKQLLMAINQICAERNLKPQVVIEAVEQALISAYRRNFGGGTNVEAQLDPETGEMRIYARMEVVAEGEVVDSKSQLTPVQAAAYDPKAQVGSEILIERTPDDFGRIAAQTAKQVILQRIREAERDAVYEDYADREGELAQGVVRTVDHSTGNLVVSLDGGRAEGNLLRVDQIPGERFRPSNTILAYVSEVAKGPRGPVIHLSRTHRNMLRRLLEKEVPEIKNGVVEIKAVAREAGSRSKVAVVATQPGVDPVGSCVGMRGVRIQNIVNELSNEKIDIVEWHAEPERFVANALSPARVSEVVMMPDHDRTALVVVPDSQLSLAIGRDGQNARLVAKLTGWRIDIKAETQAAGDGYDAGERKRLRGERKERVEADDLFKEARRLLAEEPVDTLANLPEPVAGEAAAEAEQLFDDMLARVKPSAEPIPTLDLPTPTPAPTIPLPTLPKVEEPSEDEAAARDLAAKLSRAMTSFDDEMFDDEYGVDDETYAMIFGDDELEDGEDGGAGRGKKKRKKGPARTERRPDNRGGGSGGGSGSGGRRPPSRGGGRGGRGERF